MNGKIISSIVLYLLIFKTLGQALDENVKQLDNNFLMKDGLYLDENQFKTNKPVDAEIRIIEKGEFIVEIDGDTINPLVTWGLAINGKPYVWYEDSYNKLINLGKICHFTHRELVEFNTVDAFGFPVVRTEERLVHYYFDFESVPIKFKLLNSSNIDIFLDEHKMNKNLKKNYKSNKRLMQTLRLINNTFPIYLSHE